VKQTVNHQKTNTKTQTIKAHPELVDTDFICLESCVICDTCAPFISATCGHHHKPQVHKVKMMFKWLRMSKNESTRYLKSVELIENCSWFQLDLIKIRSNTNKYTERTFLPSWRAAGRVWPAQRLHPIYLIGCSLLVIDYIRRWSHVVNCCLSNMLQQSHFCGFCAPNRLVLLYDRLFWSEILVIMGTCLLIWIFLSETTK